ncbi:MAG: dihydroorotate dehydrogenase electron transfer subunit [Desulfobacterales bacterium]
MTAQESGLIVANDSVSDGYFKIRLACADHYKNAVPGQFVTLRQPGQSRPLLRRPFSIHRILQIKGSGLNLEILYRVVGGFTGDLSETKPGGLIDILGPLGHGFSVSRYSRPVVLAAGGIGVAPLMHLADCLKQKGTDGRLINVFLGGRTKTDILCREEFLGLGARIFTATEDGTQGRKGFVTDPLLTWLKENTPAIIYACGPHAMLEAIGKIAESKKIACEVSIETLMACGLGVCMGCAVSANDAREGYGHVCKDGPVFDAGVLF